MQKYAKFLKRRVSDSIFFHKSDETADPVLETYDLREKVAEKGRKQDSLIGNYTSFSVCLILEVRMSMPFSLSPPTGMMMSARRLDGSMKISCIGLTYVR